MNQSKKPATGKLFAGSRGFDPTTIVMQILALQLAYYSSLLISVLIVDACSGLRPHLAQIFTPLPYSDLSARYGWATVSATWLNLPFVVIWQSVIVEKASKCLDFTVTILFIHFFIMWIYEGWPGWQFSFWLNYVIWATVTVLLCESLCMKLETQEIKLTINDLLEHSAQSAKKLFASAA